MASVPTTPTGQDSGAVTPSWDHPTPPALGSEDNLSDWGRGGRVSAPILAPDEAVTPPSVDGLLMAADPRASPYGAASAGQAGASPRSLAISSEASGPAGDEEEEEEDGGVDGDDDDEEDDGAGADEDEEGAVHVPEQAMLRRSLFTGRPSTLCFTRPCGTPRPGDLAPCPVPAETHMRVKSYWKRKAVRMAVRASGAVLLETRHFNLLWGKHMKPPQFKQLLPVQKVNHFPGTWCIGRKDRLWRTMSRARHENGRSFDFLPHCCKLPHDRNALSATLEREPHSLWIRKPCASSCGRGIRVVTAQEASKLCTRATRRRPFLLQRYVHDPLLVQGHKFDIRLYVCVTSFDPLRVYIHEEGLVRFATKPYSLSLRKLKDRYGHLTNYSVNKNSADFVANQRAQDDGSGSKWSLNALLRVLAGRGVDTGRLMARLSDVVVKTLIAAESQVVTDTVAAVKDPRCCFELFGFDLMVDKQLRPWLVEVNISPSIASGSPLDQRIKGNLMTDLFHMVGVRPADTKRLAASSTQGVGIRHLRTRARPRSAVSSLPTNRMNVFDLDKRGAAALTAPAAEVIREAEDEYARRGGFVRVFPTPHTGPYLRYFSCRRIGNELLAAWLQRPAWRERVAPRLGYISEEAMEAAIGRPQAACLAPVCAVSAQPLGPDPAAAAREKGHKRSHRHRRRRAPGSASLASLGPTAPESPHSTRSLPDDRPRRRPSDADGRRLLPRQVRNLRVSACERPATGSSGDAGSAGDGSARSVAASLRVPGTGRSSPASTLSSSSTASASASVVTAAPAPVGRPSRPPPRHGRPASGARGVPPRRDKVPGRAGGAKRKVGARWGTTRISLAQAVGPESSLPLAGSAAAGGRLRDVRAQPDW